MAQLAGGEVNGRLGDLGSRRPRGQVLPYLFLAGVCNDALTTLDCWVGISSSGCVRELLQHR